MSGKNRIDNANRIVYFHNRLKRPSGLEMTIFGKIFNKLAACSSQEGMNKALRDAALGGNGTKVSQLLKDGAELDSADAHNRTPLYFAAAEGHTELVRLFLKLGATPDAGESGSIEGTPLTRAAAEGHLDVVKELVAAQADLQATGYEWRTALHEALWHGHEEIAVFLADAGTATATRSRLGGTPLQDALEWNKRDAALALCRNGADATVTDKCDVTLREKAEQKGWTEVVAAIDGYKKDQEEAQLRRIEEERQRQDAFGAAIEAAPILQRDLIVGRRLILKSAS
jgi:hypothetical protein